MSEKLFNSLQEKWQDKLDENRYVGEFITEDDVAELYGELVDELQKTYGYSEKIIERAFSKDWYDTFKDMFYCELEKHDTKIIHEHPEKEDWDFGKKFKFTNFGWEEVV